METKMLVRAVKRNINRFPLDFMMQLNNEEFKNLRFQFGTSSRWGGRRYLPYAFTEQGVAMLSSVLNSKRAVKVNIEIMRAFVRLRKMLASNAALARKLDDLENNYYDLQITCGSLDGIERDGSAILSNKSFETLVEEINQVVKPGNIRKAQGEAQARWNGKNTDPSSRSVR